MIQARITTPDGNIWVAAMPARVLGTWLAAMTDDGWLSAAPYNAAKLEVLYLGMPA